MSNSQASKPRPQQATGTTAPTATPDSEATSPAATPAASPVPVSKIDQLRAQRVEIAKDATESAAALRQLEEGIGAEKARTQIAYKMIFEQYEIKRKRVEHITEQIEAEEKAAATESYTKPIIAAIGTLTVDNAKVMPATIHLVDLSKLSKVAADNLARAQSQVALYGAITEAIRMVGLSEEVIADLRPFRIKATGEKTIVLEVGTRTGATGPRASRAAAVRITKAGPEYQQLIGKVVGGEPSDFGTWRQLLEATDPAEFTRLEGKRKDGSNYSAAVISARRFKLVTEPVTTTDNTEGEAGSAEAA